MANPKPSTGSDQRRDPAPAAVLAATTTQHRHVLPTFDPYCALLVGPAVHLALRLLRGGVPAEVARDAFPHLNVLLLSWSVRRFFRSPPGLAVRGRAMFAVWVLITTLTAALTCKMSARLPLRFAVAARAMAAATVGFGLYALLFHEEK